MSCHVYRKPFSAADTLVFPIFFLATVVASNFLLATFVLQLCSGNASENDQQPVFLISHCLLSQ